MFINKIGNEHLFIGKNCQDYGFINSNIKCVTDGCSEGLHSEVGAKLFCHLFNKIQNPTLIDINLIFSNIINLIGKEFINLKNYMSFTLLYVIETEDSFIVNVCGDGYIIKVNINNEIEYYKIDNGDYPKYYIYNYIDKKHLYKYKDGVSFDTFIYNKSEYKNIGISSDGLRYAFNEDNYLINNLSNLIIQNKQNNIKRLINKNQKQFKDDITIVI